MKKLISTFVSLLLILTSYNAGATYLYTESSTERVSGGIIYEQKNILTENGWIRAYIAYVDLSNPNTAIKVMTASEGSSYLSTVKQMASDNDSAIAINGDFFNFSSGQTNMLGMVYHEGKLVSTPALDNQVSFVITDTNEVIMDYFSFEASVTSPQGYYCPIYQINKIPVESGAITMLTSDWSSKTWGSDNLKELVVENDIVTEIHEPGSGSGKMPENGYILVTNPEINGFLDNFAIGDTVTIDVTLTPDISNIKEATGGNTLIVNDGKLATFTGNVTGYAQRSSVGITEDGKTLILAATDGRETECKGLTQTGMAELMMSLGAYKAINLDGGGSTTFVKKDYNGQQKAVNSVSSLRKVSTAIGVFDNNIRGTYASSGELKADRDILLAGDSVTLNALFYDEYGNAFIPNPSDIRYFDDTDADIENGIYTPQNAGIHTLYASYGDITVNFQIEAVDDVFAIEIAEDDLSLAISEFKNLTVYGYNNGGKKFVINPSLIEWSSDSDEIAVQNGTVTAISDGGAVISAQLKNKIDYVVVNKDSYGYKAPLPQTDSDSLYGSINAKATVAISGNVPAGATLLNKYFSLTRLNNLKKYTASYLTGSYYTGAQAPGTSTLSGYSVKVYDSTTIATINSEKSYLPASELANICIAAHGSSENVVIITQKSPDELGYDGDRLKKILSGSVAAGKKVFLVTSGSKSGVKLENGVRYITVGTVADYRTSSFATDAKYCSYVVFTINGNDIGYEFVNDI